MATAAVLKITLRGLRPPVWRRVRVSGDSSLRMLHLVIQAAMGWQDYHLHEFEIGDRRYGEPDDDPWPGDAPTYNGRTSSSARWSSGASSVSATSTTSATAGSTRSSWRRWSRSTRSSRIPR